MPDIIDQPRYVCALGAVQTVQVIERAVPILHAGPGCGTKLSAALATSNGGQSSGYISPQIYPSTNISEKEVIFGGEDKLKETIENSLKVLDADLFVVLSGCVTEIVGDDVREVVRGFKESKKPVIYAETAGFKGNNIMGHELVVQAIIEQYLKPAPVIDKLVNIWATVPVYDPFWYGNLKQLGILLSEIGLISNVIFGPGNGVKALDKIPRATFNLLVSPWVGLKNVKTLEEKFGTPYLHYPVLPIGAYETGEFLRNVGKFAGVDPNLIESVIKKHEDEFYYFIERIADILLETREVGRRFVIIADSNYALAASRFLVNDMGLFPSKLYIVEDTPEEYQDLVREQFKNYKYGISAEVEFTTDGGKIHEELRNTHFPGRPIVLGSNWDKTIAKELNGHYVGISMPVTERLVLDRSYVGYQGGLRLLEDIYSVVLEYAI